LKKSMVIVESPAKARTIGKYLGKDYFVRASAGHVRDLPARILGVDIKDGFRPTYRVIPDKEKIVQSLRKEARAAGSIYLAADPDREGEAICYHLAEVLDGGLQRPILRVQFNEITKPAILEAFNHPTAIDSNKVEAQQARRILDRIVGYKVSPLLWQKVRKGLSAGRVQTVAARLIVDREREIRAFEPEEYWDFRARLAGEKPPPFEAKAFRYQGKKFKISNQEESDLLLDELREADFVVARIERKERKRRPVPPFITSKLQQEAVRRLGFSVKKTMTVAQRLYEGIELGDEGSVGLITYMRTDSTRVSDAALEEVRGYILSRFGSDYVPGKPVRYASKKGAQDAHEAIRPTEVGREPESLKGLLGRDELRLYTLIWNRFVACQMEPALFDQTEILIEAGTAEFKAVGSILRFDGFLKVYRSETEEETGEGEEGLLLPDVEAGEKLNVEEILREQKFTQPPPRYNEASLVKALEEKGIGRPSTYQQILSVILTRDYVRKEEGRFTPTELGEVVNDLLVAHFDEIFNYDYTAKLERDLDDIEDGKARWTEALDAFYSGFRLKLNAARTQMKNLRREEAPTGEVCEKCGGPMVIRWGKFGRFLACAEFPRCRNSRELATEAESSNGIDFEGESCDKCGKPMVLKKGRFGPFLSCSGFPSCRNTRKLLQVDGRTVAPAEEPVGESCPSCGADLVSKVGRYGPFVACRNYPECRYVKPVGTGVVCPECGEGELRERKSRRGRVFYGCERYPECKFVIWQKPVPEGCPDCGSSYLVEKTTKRDGTRRFCPNRECGFRASSPAEDPAGEPAGVRR
jgi:DNA topoisomerase I